MVLTCCYSEKGWFSIDYHKFNGVTHQDVYSLPRIDVTLDSLTADSCKRSNALLNTRDLQLYGFLSNYSQTTTPLLPLEYRGHLTCWLLFLQQFNFSVEYKKEPVTQMQMHSPEGSQNPQQLWQ